MNSGLHRPEKSINGNFLTGLLLKFRLVLRLMGDKRVDTLLKSIPIATLIYLIVPLDFLFGPIDDAVIIYAGMEIFIQLCPQEVVNEHLRVLKGDSSSHTNSKNIVIDADFKGKK